MQRQPLYELLRRYPNPHISDIEMEALLKGVADGRYGKVKRALARGDLLHVRRGLYALGSDLFPMRKLHPFELSQHIYGPSYVSLESALSYHGLVPEHSFVITCVTTKRSRSFKTALGEFVYHKLPESDFFIQVEAVQTTNLQFWVASPWKAIFDFVFVYHLDWQELQPLASSLRVELEELPTVSLVELEELVEYYHNKRLDRFMKGIQKDLSL